MASTSRSSVHPELHIMDLQPNYKKIEVNNMDEKCMLCGCRYTSPQCNSPLYMLRDVTVHYFCIMLSSKAVKKGSERDGIFGYLLNDIRAEIIRGSTVTCVYCNKTGATLSCISAVNCRKLFHLPCGLKNGSMHHFFSPFRSFCQEHRIQPVIDVTELPPFAYPTVVCGICDDNFVPSASPTSIWVPCCRIRGWFHRDCVQELAFLKGDSIECPKCASVDLFKDRILTLGIYIPSRYATSEKIRSFHNSIWYTLQYGIEVIPESPMQCDATRCLCPHEWQRNFQDEFRWKLVLCGKCEIRQTHVGCNSIRFGEKWNCEEFQLTIRNVPAKRLEFPISGPVSSVFPIEAPRLYVERLE